MRLKLEPAGKGRTAVALDEDVLIVGHGTVCCQAARILRDHGIPETERLEFYRGDVLCLAGSLAAFARLTVRENDIDNGPRFIPWVPFKTSVPAVAGNRPCVIPPEGYRT